VPDPAPQGCAPEHAFMLLPMERLSVSGGEALDQAHDIGAGISAQRDPAAQQEYAAADHQRLARGPEP
jgi:hypothetical protein